MGSTSLIRLSNSVEYPSQTQNKCPTLHSKSTRQTHLFNCTKLHLKICGVYWLNGRGNPFGRWAWFSTGGYHQAVSLEADFGPLHHYRWRGKTDNNKLIEYQFQSSYYGLLLSCHQTAFFHLSTHFLAFSLNF